jgi:hypothetical protein
MGVKLTKGRSVQVDVPFGGRSVRVKMFGGRSVGGRSVKAPAFSGGACPDRVMNFREKPPAARTSVTCRTCSSTASGVSAPDNMSSRYRQKRSDTPPAFGTRERDRVYVLERQTFVDSFRVLSRLVYEHKKYYYQPT